MSYGLNNYTIIGYILIYTNKIIGKCRFIGINSLSVDKVLYNLK